MLQTLRGLSLPALSMAAVVGAVYLVSHNVTSTGEVRPHHKIDALSHAPKSEQSLPVNKPPAMGDGTSGTDGKILRDETATDTAAGDDQAVDKAAVKAVVSKARWAETYDSHFRKYTKRYFSISFDWRWFKAQAIVESTLNPAAHSRAGAVGLMQIKPLTFGDIRKRHPEIENLHTPRWNIAAGICYVRRLYDKAALKLLPNKPRLYLAFASYNAGYTRMLRVMRRAPPEETGWRTTLEQGPLEARNYVERIIKVKTNI